MKWASTYAITRDITPMVAMFLTMFLCISASVVPVIFIQDFRNIDGLYQNPPTTNDETAAKSTPGREMVVSMGIVTSMT